MSMKAENSPLNTQIGGSHYKDCKIQPMEYIEANGLRFAEGCVVKRVTRHDKPTGKGRQDIEKAIHELQLLLELRYPPEADKAELWAKASVPVEPDPVASFIEDHEMRDPGERFQELQDMAELMFEHMNRAKGV